MESAAERDADVRYCYLGCDYLLRTYPLTPELLLMLPVQLLGISMPQCVLEVRRRSVRGVLESEPLFFAC